MLTKMRLSYCFLITLLPLFSAKDTVPTFLIDYDQVMDHLFIEQNPFTRTSVSKFADIVEDAVAQSSVIIIFVEERLSTEDITIKDEKGTPFQNLHELLMSYKVKYIPNVVSPVKLLTRVLEPTELNVVVLPPNKLFEPSESMRFFYVFFKDEKDETRTVALRRHDKLMQEVYETTRKITNGAVIAFYTGKVNPVVFTNYDYGPTDVHVGEDPTDITMASNGALLRFKGLSVDEGPAPTRRSSQYAVEDTPKILLDVRSGNNTSSTQVSVGKYYMEFAFIFAEENWILDNITVYQDDAVGGRKEGLGISVPYGRSYYCDEPLIFFNKNDNSSIVIPENQIQPFRQVDISEPDPVTSTGNATASYSSSNLTGSNLRLRRQETSNTPVPTNTSDSGDDADFDDDDVEGINTKLMKFGKPIRCTNYFNIEILTGLSVFALFLTVLMIAIFGLYHLETNDRFEDPHGKQFYTTTTE